MRAEFVEVRYWDSNINTTIETAFTRAEALDKLEEIVKNKGYVMNIEQFSVPVGGEE